MSAGIDELESCERCGDTANGVCQTKQFDDFRYRLTCARILRMQIQNAQGVIKHELEMPPIRTLESVTSIQTSYLGRSFPGMISDLHGGIGHTDGTFVVRRGFAEGSTPRIGNSQSAEDDLESDESFNRHIDETLGAHGASFDRSSQALYEDIRSMQRKIVEFARESLEATEDLPPSYDHSHGTQSGSHMLGTQPQINTSSDLADRHGVSVTIPYKSSRSEKLERGLTLLKLREKKQVLIEDTLGYFHYVPSSIGETWEVRWPFTRCILYQYLFPPSHPPPSLVLHQVFVKAI